MRVFIYRRTHVGDPCRCGIFGVEDCMGRDRSRAYDAVIGVGGVSTVPKLAGIAGRLTWVGIGPHEHRPRVPHRGPHVTFTHFCLMDKDGPLLREDAPLLARYMFEQEYIPRSGMSESLPRAIQGEIVRLLHYYRRSPSSSFTRCQCQRGIRATGASKQCKSSC